jgi:3D (Asp-Asp-Asp) domain-containing protein
MIRLILSLMVLAIGGLTPAQAAFSSKGKQLRLGKSFEPQTSGERVVRPERDAKTMKVTLTTYWARGKGADRWTRRFQSATGLRLQQGVSVAADPRVLPYGTVIEIPGVGRRVVKDTGSHVVERVASRKRGVDYPVVDIFFNTRDEALRFARSNPPFAEIRVVQSGG